MTESSRCYNKNGYLIYEGQVVDSKREGQGIEYAKDGKGIKYEGFFENDIPVLKNRQIYNENSKLIFSGEFRDEEPYFGVYYSPDTGQIKYAGHFKNCKLHGELNYVFNDDCEIFLSGKFIDGKPLNEGFIIFYKSGATLYKGLDNVTGSVYHDSYYLRHYKSCNQYKVKDGNGKEFLESIKLEKRIFLCFNPESSLCDLNLENSKVNTQQLYMKSLKFNKTDNT